MCFFKYRHWAFTIVYVSLCAGSLGSSKKRICKAKDSARSHWAPNIETWYSTGNASVIGPRTMKVSKVRGSACIVDLPTSCSIPSHFMESNFASSITEETTNELELYQVSAVAPPSLSDIGISDAFEGKIGRRSSKFFYGLPYAKRHILLKRTENMTTTSTEFGLNLAVELDLPVQSVASWLSRKRYKNLRILRNPTLTSDKMSLLQELFQYSNDLNEERALLLSYELELPVGVIYDWFELTKINSSQSQTVYCISDEEAELPSAKVTPNDVTVSSDDDGSCSSIETYVDVDDDVTDKFVFSEKVAARTVKYRHKFFYGLPYSKQIALLKKSRYLTINQTSMAKKLARRLNLPYESVFSWLSRKRYRNLRLLQISKVSDEQELLLEDEFQLSQELNDERALMLSYELVLPIDKIEEWFESRRNSVETKIIPMNV